MKLLGESSLEMLPVVLSGLRSVERSRQVAPYRVAVRTVRSLAAETRSIPNITEIPGLAEGPD